jgi:hypothetical protein
MKEIFDPRALGAESKIDIGIFFLGAGLGGILDAVLNVAEFAEPLAFATMCGPAVFGAKKLIEGLWEKPKAGEPPHAH